MEKSIIRSREYSESILNTIREPFIVLDQNLRVVSASCSFYAFFQARPEETVGQLIYDLGNRQWDIAGLRELLETILPQKTAFDNYEVEHDFTTIGRRIMLLNARQIERLQGIERIILLAMEDITERKRLENLLTEPEMIYRRLFETASDGILLLEKSKGHIVWANPAAERMLAYSEKEFVEKSLQDICESIDMNDFPTLMQDLEKNGILNYNEVQVKTKFGQYIDTDIYLVYKATLTQCNIRDITERQSEKKKNKQYSERLELMVEERTRELEKIQHELLRKEKLAAIGQISGSVAHDLRNPLGVISNAVFFLKQIDNANTDPKIKKHLAIMEREIKTSGDIISDLMDFSRENPLTLSRGSINDLLRDMLQEIQLPDNIVLGKKLDSSLPEIQFDQPQIRRVFHNLINNARQAMPEGGRLEVLTRMKNGAVEVLVTDTGSGISEENMAHIFEPLFTTKSSGVGLGLAIVKNFVEKHNGTVDVESELGKGTTFTVRLPVRQEEG